MSDSNLTAVMNAWRKGHKRNIRRNGAQVFSFPNYGVTVVIKRTGSMMGEFSVSIMSPEETKFRRKVGEYYALQRFDDEYRLPVALSLAFNDPTELERAASEIARVLGRN